jgi:hypothetical protein
VSQFHPLRPRFVSLASLGISLLTAGLAGAQAQTDAGQAGVVTNSAPASLVTRDEAGQVQVRATRVSQSMDIDGRLDEEVYRLVPPITEFIQQEPVQGAPVSERTEVWLLYDESNIYIACRCWDTNPDRIVANDMRRDGSRQTAHDNIGVTLDPFYDRRNGYLFGMTAVGGLRDGQTTDERPNMNWNGVFDGKATRFEQGWMGEMIIPFRTIRYSPGSRNPWGVQIRRFINGKNERVHLTDVSPGSGPMALNFMSQAATLTGLETPPAALNLDIKPYAFSSLTTDRVGRPPVENDYKPDAGIDIRYGLSESMTADFTYNTDFAQVEADDAQVNLTRFNLSFPEKREFFLEGSGTFAFGTSGGTGGGGGNDAPQIFYSRRIGLSGTREVPVIAGGRVTGKIGPWGIGVLNMETDDEPAANALETNFSVVRIRRDILRKSAIGAVYTRRSVSTVAPGANDVYGLDANFGFYENFYMAAYVAQSQTNGRFGDDISYRGHLNYNGDRYGLSLEHLVVQPNFNPEVGFMRRQNFKRSSAQARFSPRTANNPLVRRWSYQGGFDYVTDNEDHLESREASGQFRTEFHNSDSVSVEHLRLYEFLPRAFEISRGVTLPMGGYTYANTRFSYSAGQTHRVSGTTTFETGSFYGGDKKTAEFSGRVEITPQLGVEPNLSFNWVDLPEGEFTNTVIGGRATYTMTAQMFVAALVQYSSSNTSLLANLRFRWEYSPGSEFFVVYTEGRSTFPPRGTDLQSRGVVVKINRLFRL